MPFVGAFTVDLASQPASYTAEGPLMVSSWCRLYNP